MKMRKPVTYLLLILFISLHPHHALSSGKEGAADTSTAQESAEVAPGKIEGKEDTALNRGELIREGLKVEFSAKTSKGAGGPGGKIYGGDFVDISFRISDGETGEPLRGLFPGAWMDMGETILGKERGVSTCKDRAGLYLQGLVGIRPMIDLNSYYLLVMNQDPTIAVIDPIIGITGITKLYAQIILKRAGADWAKTADEKRLFVSMPVADMVAVVDTDTFTVTHNIAAGDQPMRVRLQPDGKYLWVGNDSREEGESGVTVIEADSLKRTARIATGKGHHEIVFSDDSRYAFVTNRDGGTVTVIDVQSLEKVKEVETGPVPISLAYSTLSKSLYVADGREGAITVVDGRSHEIVTRIVTKPGLGPMGFSQDGRWGVVVNSREDLAYVFDPSVNSIVHEITVGDEPYQVAFSRSFAYVRSLGTERVSMIDLTELGKEGTVPVTSFPAGEKAPNVARDLSMADSIIEAPGEAAVMVVSPADTTVYYYMEGMNTPMGNFRNYGHRPRAAQVIDRSMKEKAPGLYSSTVRLPEPGTYDVIFILDSPTIVHCFNLTAEKNPLLKYTGPALKIEYLVDQRKVSVGEEVSIRFKLTDPESGNPRTDLKDVQVLYYNVSGQHRRVVPARHTEEGVYEAALTLPARGGYSVFVSCPSLKVNYNDLMYLTLLAEQKKPTR